jgi:uncharacterized protein (TIGR00299 family) protein
MRHLQLDPVGGIAGDMFVAALLDAAPEQEAACLAAAEAVAGVPCRLLRHRDHVLAGARFWVPAEERAHAHTAWRAIRERLLAVPLAAPVRKHALGIFGLLAEAEARVHGIEPEAVTFHEVGAADSIADIVAAAWLIAAQADADGEAEWSCGPLPLGAGRVATAHGALPIPAPAVAVLLENFAVLDDGIGGERVTPTGAAILRYLGANRPAPQGARRMIASGIGFGTRSLPGLSNVLLVLVTEAQPDAPAHARRNLAVVAFEVDDQSAEDLAAGLDRVRATAGVHDVLQMPAFGKKGRLVTHVQVLAEPAALEAAVEACFRETSTIGLRTQIVPARALWRRTEEVRVGGHAVRVKRVQRPGGVTGKAESDDLRDASGHAERARLRRATERLADE